MKWNISVTRGKKINKDFVSSGVAKTKKKPKLILKKAEKIREKLVSEISKKNNMSRAQHEQLLVRKEEDHLLSFNIIQLTDSVKYREGMFEKNPK